MILVDVYVPALDKTYDFQLDENVRIDELTAEIAEMLLRERRLGENKNVDEFILCSMDNQVILNDETTLSENGITNGGKLMLV